jgi:hypothetical protein
MMPECGRSWQDLPAFKGPLNREEIEMSKRLQICFLVLLVAALNALGAEGTSTEPDQNAAAAGGQEAGKVTREVPKGTVERQGKGLPLVTNDPVDWNDVVRTQDKGRLQITLTDGSVLSVGSRSEMTIVKHDADAQQTDIDLTTGTMRVDVKKITKDGGHFNVHTKTAVIGVTG